MLASQDVDSEVKRRFIEKGKGPKPPARESPLPDLIVYTQDFDAHSGTPKVVATRLKEMKEQEKSRIGDAWKAAGSTTTYIPNTPQARRLHEAAKLKNRIESRHAKIVNETTLKVTKSIEMPPDTVTLNAVEID
jgi:hypothetical protein